MLDFVFLVLMVITLVKANKGEYNELLCNIALVVGIIASVLGMISAFFGDYGDSFFLGITNLLVLVIAFALKPVAKHFNRLYQDKLDEQRRIIDQEIERVQANFNRSLPRDNSYINAEPTSVAGPVPPGNGALPDNQPLRNDPEAHENNILPKS